MLSGEAPLTLRGGMILSSGRKADVRRCLDEIEVAPAKDPGLPREAFEPVNPGILAPPLTARQNSLFAALKAETSRNRERSKATRLRHIP